MTRNIVINDSVLSVFNCLSNTSWLEGIDDFQIREVGGLHNLSTTDKERWTRNHGEGLRIVERDTGREEVWFGHRINRPQYVSLDKEGRIQSHHKFSSIWVPALHYSPENLFPDGRVVGSHVVWQPFKSAVSIWCRNGNVHCIRDRLQGRSGLSTEHCALEAKGMVFKPKDPKADDYIDSFYFERIKESWEEGDWLHTCFTGFRILFHKEELNTVELHDEMQEWLNEHCKHGFFPFGDSLFGSDEEEFLFLTEFCT